MNTISIESFNALVATSDDNGKVSVSVNNNANADLLAKGDAIVRVEWSGINYKDALAVTSKGKILRASPIIPGVDYAGTLVNDTENLKSGAQVVMTGRAVGEKYSGGFAQFARIDSSWLTPLPNNLNARQAMTCGTAGVTAALCVLALKDSGHIKDSATIAVSGASGGVGSFSVRLLAKLGYKVCAISRPAAADYLKKIGASDLIPREEMSIAPRALEKSRWDGAIDTVGGNILARLLAEVNYGGVIAACGLAADAKLNTTVMPFILRGARLDGVDSVMIPDTLRARAWQLLADTLSADDYQMIESEVVDLSGIANACEKVLQGDFNGRILVSPDGIA